MLNYNDDDCTVKSVLFREIIVLYLYYEHLFEKSRYLLWKNASSLNGENGS
jgi:hypothetical protein